MCSCVQVPKLTVAFKMIRHYLCLQRRILGLLWEMGVVLDHVLATVFKLTT